jgi:hypothetical protein
MTGVSDPLFGADRAFTQATPLEAAGFGRLLCPADFHTKYATARSSNQGNDRSNDRGVESQQVVPVHFEYAGGITARTRRNEPVTGSLLVGCGTFVNSKLS